MAELKKTTSGTPYIELIDNEGHDYGTFIFSKITATSNGYKYLCFTHRYTDQMCRKKGKGSGATSKFTEVEVNDSYTFNMLLKRDEEGKKGVPQGMMPRRLVDWIIATLSEFTDDNIFPFSAIDKLKPIIDELDIDAILVTEEELAKKMKRKARIAKKKAKIAAEDKANEEEDILRGEILKSRNDEVVAITKKESIKLTDVF